MTGAHPRKPKGSEHRQEEDREELDHELDEALEESFPGSDPVSISQPTGKKPE